MLASVVVVVGAAHCTDFFSITIHVHTCYAVVHQLQLITMIQLSWRIFFLELSLENVSLLDCGGTAISMTRRMSRCWASEVDLRGRPHLPRQVTMLRSLRGALDDVLGIRPPPWGDGTLACVPWGTFG